MRESEAQRLANGRRNRLVAILREAAVAGKTCPSNLDLAATMGCSPDLVSHDLHELRLAGKIRTRGTGTAREVEFPDGVTISPDAQWAEVRDRVCEAFGLPVFKLVAGGRKPYVVRVRKATAWVMRHKCKGISWLSIGRLMGGKDHSSVAHYIAGAEILRERDDEFRAITDAVMGDRVPPKPVVRKVVKKSRPQLVPEYRPPVYSWCSQCDSRVTDEAARRCASRWCSLKAVA